MRAIIITAGLTLILAGTVLGDPDNPGGHPDLTGTWVLNEKESDTLESAAGQGRNRGGAPPPGRGGGGRGLGGGRGTGMGRGGGGGGAPDDQQRDEMQKRREQMRERVSRFVIHQEGTEFNVADGLEITRLLYTDGREQTIWTEQGQALATAAWQGSELVVRWRPEEEAPEQVQRFRVDPETDRLSVTSTLRRPDSDQTLEMTMVYDREG
jgi:hypothetical protein